MNQINALSLPSIELDMIEAFITNRSDHEYRDYYDLYEIESHDFISELQIAVAKILLKPLEKNLPQRVNFQHGKGIKGRKKIKRVANAQPIGFNPKLLFMIHWAMSMSGSWPESYHITFIPGFDKYIVTASRDCEDAFGCTDHAIGWGDAIESEYLIAKRLIQDYWRYLHKECCQDRWFSLVDEGIIDKVTGENWADEIFPPCFEPEDDDF